MIELILILKMLVITYVLSDLAEFISELINMLINTKKKSLGVIKSLIVYMMGCNRCFSFWFSLIMTGDLFIASTIAILIYFLKKINLGGDTEL